MSVESEVYDDKVEGLVIAAGLAHMRGVDAVVDGESLTMVLTHLRILMSDRSKVIDIHKNNGKGYCIECRNSYRWPCPTLKAHGVSS